MSYIDKDSNNQELAAKLLIETLNSIVKCNFSEWQ